MVGSATLRLLEAKGFTNLITATRQELDLKDQQAVAAFFRKRQPEHVVMAAAKVGGIGANSAHPAEFLHENLVIQTNVIHEAYRTGQVKKLVFLGSSCIFPREAEQPIREDSLLTGPLEPTNEAYAIAKIAGLKMVEYYAKQYGFPGISLMPCNLYGPNDSFDLEHSHVLSALVRKFVDAAKTHAPTVEVWGTGKPRREFMHVDDMARAVLHMMESYEDASFINIGTGTDVTIEELAFKIRAATGFEGEIAWNTERPDGMPRKCMDVTRMRATGFTPSISLDEGIDQMVKVYENWKRENSVI